MYKAANYKWTKGIGGELIDPEDYCNFELRDPENFSRYNVQFREMLTWIYMFDQKMVGVLSGL